MIRRIVSALILEIFSGLLLLIPAGLYLVANQLATGPIDVTVISKSFVQNQTLINRDQSVETEHMKLYWEREFRQLKIIAQNLSVFDRNREKVAHLNLVEAYLQPIPALFGQFQATLVEVEMGWVNMQQIAPTQWAIAGVPLPPLPERALPRTLSGWENLINNLVVSSLSFLQNNPNAKRLPAISMNGIRIDYYDLNEELTLSVHEFNGVYQKEMRASKLDISAESQGEVGKISIVLSSSDQYQSVDARISGENFIEFERNTTTECNSVSFCSNFQKLDLSFQADQSGVSSIKLLTIAKNIWVNGVLLAEEFHIDSVFDDRDDVLDMRIFSDGTTVADGKTSVVIKGVSNQPSRHEFTLSGNDLLVQLIDWYPVKKLPLKGLSAKGIIDFEENKVEIESAQFELSEAFLNMDGEMRLNLDKPTWPIIGNVDLVLDGTLSREELLELWPSHVTKDSRDYVVDQIRTATITDGSIKFQFDENTIEFDTARLIGDFIYIDFEAKDAVVDVLYDAPLVKDVSGSVHINSKKLLGTVKQAKVDTWTVTRADIEIIRLGLPDAEITVNADTHGDVTGMMRMAANSRLQLTELYDFDPTRFTGEAVATATYKGPVEDEPDEEEMTLVAKASVVNAGLTEAVGEVDLTDVQAEVDLTFETMKVVGTGLFGVADVEFTYFDDFTEDDTPADIVTKSIVNPDILSRLGLLGRAYFSGDVPIHIVATNTAERVETAKANIDLTNAKIDVEEVGWFKPAGEEAHVEILYFDRIERIDVDAAVKSQNAELESSYVFDDEGELLFADVKKVFVRDQAKFSGQFEVFPDGALKVDLTGEFVDVSAVLEDLTWLARADPSTFPITLSAKFDSIELLNENNIENVDLTLKASADGSISLSGSGVTPKGASFQSFVDSNNTENQLRITSKDAGFFVSAFLGWDGLKGGDLDVVGNLSNDNIPGRFDIGIKNTRTKNVPFATQLLSLVSITGFADALTGEGVLFSNIEVPVTIQEDRLEIEGARAYGSALGITANGYIDNEVDKIHIDGVLVPSLPLNLNTVVGNIPIFGPLIVGSDGQGVFSIIYRIRGNATAPSMGVVPLSSVAPGILRRIFENPTTELPDYGKSANNRSPETKKTEEDGEGSE